MAQPVQLQQTLFMVRGDVKEWSFAVKDEASAAINVASATGLFTAKLRMSDPDASAIFQVSAPTGITFDANASGTGTLHLYPANTSAVPDVQTTLVFDFQVKIGGNPYTVSRGNLIVYPDVTLS